MGDDKKLKRHYEGSEGKKYQFPQGSDIVFTSRSNTLWALDRRDRTDIRPVL